MDNQNKPQGNQLQIEVGPDVAQGVYVNFALIAHSSSEFVMDLASVLPGLQKATVRTRAILAPEHAKRLAMALQENIARYEQEFGKIQLPNSKPRTISPFNIGNKGEA
ncbi:MAG: DUF3467 domain-containing protein [Prevotella sp.]|nr:DUF3467 domain-containing protein [Prevotella sp.]